MNNEFIKTSRLYTIFNYFSNSFDYEIWVSGSKEF